MNGGEHHSVFHWHIDDGTFGQMWAVGITHKDIAMQHLALFPWVGYLHHIKSLMLHDVEQSGIRQAQCVCPALRLPTHAGSAGIEGDYNKCQTKSYSFHILVVTSLRPFLDDV